MSEELYDEFGNYIGPDLDEDDDESSEEEDDDDNDEEAEEPSEGEYESNTLENNPILPRDTNESRIVPSNMQEISRMGLPSNAIVLHEDKVHYPTAAAVFGPDVTTAVLDEDAMDIDTPMYQSQPSTTRRSRSHFSLAQPFDPSKDGTVLPQQDPTLQEETQVLFDTRIQLVSEEYLSTALLNNPVTSAARRGVALVGHLHTGKTTLVDLLFEHTLRIPHPFGLLRTSQEVYSSIRASVPSGRGKNSSASHVIKGDADYGYNAAPLHGGIRITDTLRAEQDRQLSLQSTPITLPLGDSRGKTHAITIIDCPGHVQFHDESVAALRCVDGVVLTVDAVEGVMMHTEMLIAQIVSEGLPVVLVITKVDRLITELKLPPNDSYYKLRHLIDSVNELIQEKSLGRYPIHLCPARGNVAFASAMHGYLFTLHTFAQIYLDHMTRIEKEDSQEDDDDYNQESTYFARKTMKSLGKNLTVEDFSKRLWGESYLDPFTRTFKKHARDCTPESSSSSISPSRTFVQFILEPIYKIYTACLGEPEDSVNKTLRKVGVLLSKDELRASSRPLLRAAFHKFFGHGTGVAGFVDLVVQHTPSPKDASKGKVHRCYSGPIDSPIANAMIDCDPNAPLMMHIVKMYATHDGQAFSAFGRVYSGTVRPGDRVRVMGEAYSPDGDNEDVAIATVTAVSIPRGRRRTAVSMAIAGNWVLLDGVDATIAKTATITSVKTNGAIDQEYQEDLYTFSPLKFSQAGGEAVMKLSIEPLNPADLPKMVESLRRVSKSYPMVRTRVEESGEHVLFGTGELYLDCVMHDLRHVFSDIEVKVADPAVGFRETVAETSSIKCFAETANKRNKLTFIAEPLDDGLAETLEAGKVNLNWDTKKMGRFFQTKYDWDLLSARSVWAFGPTPKNGPNIIMDDTLPSEVDKQLLNSCKSSIVQGFQWATREGPLCEEPVRSTKVKILDVVLADKPILRGGGQIIPTTRRVVHSSLLTATPRLMEPVYRVQLQCPGEIIDAIQPIIFKRRGHVVQDKPIAGTPLNIVKAFLPVMDSFGFETDIRTFTQGQVMIHSVFDHWSVVPGDPMDKSIILHPLEPSPMQHLAREFMVKTRRRKGLSDDVSIVKFFDEGMRTQFEY